MTLLEESDERAGETEAPAQIRYRPKPPLWSAATRKKDGAFDWFWRGLFSLLLLGLLGGLAAAYYLEHLWSREVGREVVRVVAVEGGQPQRDELPAVFHHQVALLDGRRLRMSGPRIYSAGTHIEVSVWRGGVTGRLRVRGPYRVLREDDDLIPDGWGRATR